METLFKNLTDNELISRYKKVKKMKSTAAYMGDKRKSLVEKFGYDTKNAAHLIRLLRMSIEVLTEGKVYVQRRDASELLEIKNGKWTLEQVKEEASRLFILAQEAYIRSSLPKDLDKTKVDELLKQMFELHFKV